MLAFLAINGIDIECNDQELIHFGLSVASNAIKIEDITKWIINH